LAPVLQVVPRLALGLQLVLVSGLGFLVLGLAAEWPGLGWLAVPLGRWWPIQQLD
jgi:hypothetical protein